MVAANVSPTLFTLESMASIIRTVNTVPSGILTGETTTGGATGVEATAGAAAAVAGVLAGGGMCLGAGDSPVLAGGAGSRDATGRDGTAALGASTARLFTTVFTPPTEPATLATAWRWNSSFT